MPHATLQLLKAAAYGMQLRYLIAPGVTVQKLPLTIRLKSVTGDWKTKEALPWT
jgi:hypothetical protein